MGTSSPRLVASHLSQCARPLLAALRAPENRPLTRENSNVHSLNKTDLIEALDMHLQADSTRLRDNPAFEHYYETLNRSSPRPNTGAPRATATPEPPRTEKRVTKRRQTAVGVAKDTAADASETVKKTATKTKKHSDGVLAKTPQSIQKLAAKVPLPSSPQAVTSLIEKSSAKFNETLSTTLDKSGIPTATASTRAMLGGVHAITTLFALFEAASLNRAIIPYRHAFTVAVPALGTFRIKFPDFFILLTAEFWKPVLLWATLALFLPTTAGWLFNISGNQGGSRRYRYSVDPVVFNTMKAVCLAVFFGSGWANRDEYVDPRTSGTVDGAVMGGWWAMLVGSCVCAGLGVWEGVVRGQGRA